MLSSLRRCSSIACSMLEDRCVSNDEESHLIGFYPCLYVP